ncbi:MAG: tryptophan synthase subunit alpha, partial [Candidatus Omnitrophota bacterium]
RYKELLMGANRIDQKFRELKKARKKAFIAYITAGDPDISTTEKLVPELEARGVDIIELGVPFSDPLADGPIIQAASERALKNNVNLGSIFSLVKRLRSKTNVPITLMTYYNPVFKFGLDRFAKMASAAGVDGVIIPDLPPEEAKALQAGCRANNIHVIFLLSPTSTAGRVRLIARQSRGFIYFVSLTGVTGERKNLPLEIRANVRRIKRCTKKPVCVGFGVSRPDQARAMAKISDGVIVGSAIIRAIEANRKKSGFINRTGRFVSGLSRAVHNI